MIHVGSNVYSMYNGSNRVKLQTPLPDDYVECDWVAADKDTYINTGIYVNAKSSIEITAKYYNFSSTGWSDLFGTRRTGTSVSNRYGCVMMEDNNNLTTLCCLKSTGSNTGGTRVDFAINRNDRANEWHVFGIYSQNTNSSSARIDGKSNGNFPQTANTTTFQNPLFLLSMSEDEGATNENFCHQYIKSCKIWDENNNLVGNFIPVYKKSTQKFGLFNIINKTFVTSGNENALIGPSRNHNLPSGYTEVDFIRFTGTQYIDFPEAFNQTDAVEVEWKWNDYNTVQQRVFTTTPSNTGMLLYINGQKAMSFNYGSAENWVVLVTNGADCGRNYCKIDGYNKSLSGNIHNTAVTKDLSVYTETTTENLLRVGKHATANTWSKMDVYYLNKWENNIQTRQCIPCYNSNNVYGFYDIIKNEFITATQGTLQGGYIKD